MFAGTAFGRPVPPIVDDLAAVASIERPEGEDFEAFFAGLERPYYGRSHPYQVSRLQVNDLVVELHATGAGDDEVDLLGPLVAMPEPLPLPRLEGVVAEPRLLGVESSLAKRDSWRSAKPNKGAASGTSVTFLCVYGGFMRITS